MPHCLVSFGSNLGDRQTVLAEAAGRLARSGFVNDFRTSRLFQTPPIGGGGQQEPFLNAVGAFQTDASAREVLAALQQIEQHLGRQRRRRWDARSIDLDVVLHGDLTGGGSNLIVPHPRYTARTFVLEPACDVAAAWRDPRFGWTIEQLARHLRQGVPSIALVGGDAATRRLLCQRVSERFPVTWFREPEFANPITLRGTAPLIAHRQDNEAMQPKPTGDPTTVGEISDARPKIEAGRAERWLSAYVPPLPAAGSPEADDASTPRLIGRLQWTDEASLWPAPHQIWPRSGRWPEYRLEINDLDWAVNELGSALDSMRCPVLPVTEDGQWFAP